MLTRYWAGQHHYEMLQCMYVYIKFVSDAIYSFLILYFCLFSYVGLNLCLQYVLSAKTPWWRVLVSDIGLSQ